MPGFDHSVPLESNLGHDWRKHYAYGMRLLQEPAQSKNGDVFARAAFASASRFSRDYAPAFVGLGIAEMRLGNFANAEVAFLNAALTESRSRFWAYGAIAALNNGDEAVARAFYDGMQRSAQESDPASNFIRDLYQTAGYFGSIERLQSNAFSGALPIGFSCTQSSNAGASSQNASSASDSRSGFGSNAGAGDYVDEDDEEEEEDNASLQLDAPYANIRITKSTRNARTQSDICNNLNIIANVYFVRRYSSDSAAQGNDFFNDLTFQLNASRSREWSRESGSASHNFLQQFELSIPEIQYALRVTPQLSNSSVQVSAAPSVMTSLGYDSKITEGADMTILYNSTGDAQQYTAKTGMMLHLKPELATPDYVKLALNFEYSTVSSLEPSGNAQVLGVASDSYSITGTFPYGRPVVLGTISTGSNSFGAKGQMGLRRVPVLGGAFGSSTRSSSTADTIVLGVLTEPEEFRGTRERKMITAMREKGVAIRNERMIERRRSVHSAPDVVKDGIVYLQSIQPQK